MKSLLVLAALGGLAAASSAQSLESPTNIAFRLGIAFPFDERTRDATGNLLDVGADFFLNRSLIKGERTETFFSVDWLSKSGNGSKGNMFPILVNQRWYSPQTMGDENRTYFHAGLGVALMDIGHSETVLAGRFGGGMEFSRHLFGEANFLVTGDADGYRGTSIAFQVGYRF